ncbi:TBC1 domain family member 14-like isoform X2 [Lethenteron reissneri]|uniref:TBC1 domain family member 14-like isoform X2 n=2 Tax=Lethenteron reissneri TaxID=7753 RepID=UPI002AB6D569|nr:TBC1 domain family member 14-like isoform X2 [Lethenteron reissneri]
MNLKADGNHEAAPAANGPSSVQTLRTMELKGPVVSESPCDAAEKTEKTNDGISVPVLQVGDPDAAHPRSRGKTSSLCLGQSDASGACAVSESSRSLPPAPSFGSARYEAGHGVRRPLPAPRPGCNGDLGDVPDGLQGWHGRTDGLSLSSTSTELSGSVSLSDFSGMHLDSASSAIVPLHTDESMFMDVNLHARNSCEWAPGQKAEPRPPGAEPTHAPQGSLQGLSGFFSRSLFGAKVPSSSVGAGPSVPGWRLFGRVPVRSGSNRDSRAIQKEYEDRARRSSAVLSGPPVVRRPLEFEPLSTTALILENRPAHLPAKPPDEAERHQQLYDEMVLQAKKREVREMQRRKKQLKERCKQEENISISVAVWNTEILPHWDRTRQTRKAKDLWWQGIPPSVRGRVWRLTIGNELNITHELYEIFLSRAEERWKSFSETSSNVEAEEAAAAAVAATAEADREASLELIKLDISRTFPTLCIFQKGGPYHDVLHSVLGAYTCYRPDVGYGMSFIAAVLLLNMDTADAFIAFANLLNRPCQMAFFRVDHGLMLAYFAAFEVFFEETLPQLFSHFKKNNLTPDIYLIDWIFTLYSKSLPLDVACRVWDIFCRDGEEFLFRTALAILHLYDDVLLHMDFIHMAQLLTRLPEDLQASELFSSISAIQLQSRNKKWSQVLATLLRDCRDSGRSSKANSPSLRH